jgi:hypothetical protein
MYCKSMDATEKVREARLRRLAQRQGLKLVRSRRRDPRAADFGRYTLVDPDSNRAIAGEPSSSMTLDDVEAWLSSTRPESVEVTVDQGRRVVKRSITGGDGTVVVIEHDFPDAVQHHYSPAGTNQDVLLYRGEFALPGDGRVFEGDIRYRWDPSPHVEVRGERTTTPADLDALAALLSGTGQPGRWVMPGTVAVNLPGGALPHQPRKPFTPRGLAERSFHEDRIEQQLGDPTTLEQATFLVPNGWTGHDGDGICDPDEPGQAWRGRAAAAGDGWTVTFDRYASMDTAAWGELRNSGGRRFTHVGRLARTDGSAFTGEEAFEALDRVRMGLNLALGRRVTCALPVGWRDGRPVWCRWRSGRVDGYRDASQWLDDTASYRQVSEVVSRVLDYTASPVDKESFRYALSYYLTANVDVDVELSASVPVSGLQLLAFLRCVTYGPFSRSQWRQKDTEEEIRLLVSQIGIQTSVPAHFSHLASAQARLVSTGAPARDALGTIVKMRNVVTHPTRDQPGTFSVYEWAEAGLLARYWLCLSLLNTVGYCGQIAEIMQPQPHWTGWMRQVPWQPPTSP